MTLDIRHGDNLATLAELKAAGAKFDLVELDGPYMAGLEDWDSLSEAEYIQHYADRLALVRDVLQPWGVVFVFGYPEGCAEIKSWAHRSGTLNLRRWVSWYNNRAAHAGRKVQTILMLTQIDGNSLMADFRSWLKERRLQMGLSLRDARRLTGINAHLLDNPQASSGGYFWYEATCSTIPTREDYATLKHHFGVPDHFDILTEFRAFDGVTDLDFISVPVEKATQLNDAGLRSKPIQLYLDLFRSVKPPFETTRALVLYGGSGNAGIAAAALGYDVTICEADPARVALIRDRWAGQVAKWTEKAQAKQAALPMAQAAQGALFGAEVTR